VLVSVWLMSNTEVLDRRVVNLRHGDLVSHPGGRATKKDSLNDWAHHAESI